MTECPRRGMVRAWIGPRPSPSCPRRTPPPFAHATKPSAMQRSPHDSTSSSRPSNRSCASPPRNSPPSLPTTDGRLKHQKTLATLSDRTPRNTAAYPPGPASGRVRHWASRVRRTTSVYHRSAVSATAPLPGRTNGRLRRPPGLHRGPPRQDPHHRDPSKGIYPRPTSDTRTERPAYDRQPPQNQSEHRARARARDERARVISIVGDDNCPGVSGHGHPERPRHPERRRVLERDRCSGDPERDPLPTAGLALHGLHPNRGI